MAKLSDRRKADRERQKRWRNKKLAEGNRMIQVMLTPGAQKSLENWKKQTGLPYVEIINRALEGFDERQPREVGKAKARSASEMVIIERIRSLRSQGKSYTEIARKFNEERLSTFKGFSKWYSWSVSHLDRQL